MWLWGSLTASGAPPSGCLLGALARIDLANLAGASSLGGGLEALRGRSVLLATGDQLTAALALIELDGVAGRLVLCPPDLPAAQLPFVVATAEVQACVTDRPAPEAGVPGVDVVAGCSPLLAPADA